MITPGYNLIASERVLPRMALDFTTGVLDARVTVTRALNTATCVNSSGVIAIVNANLPRFDYDPISLACKGLLIEESRTNSMTYSGEIQTYWSAAFSTLSAFSSTAPDGTGTVCQVLPNTSANVHGAQRTLSTTGEITFSIFAKSNGYNRLVISGNNTNYVYFNLDTGVIESSLGTNWTAATVTPAGNGWYRCSATTSTAMGRFDVFAFNALQTNGNTGPSFTGDGTSSILIWGAQVEAGGFPTSYIPTTTTSLTRNLDSVAMTGANFSDWFNASEGTFVVGVQKFTLSSQSTYAFETVGINSTYSLRVRLGTDARMQSVDNGAVQVDSQLAGSVPSTPAKYAMAYKLNDYAGAANGAATVTDTSATVPALSSLSIGSAEVQNLYARTIYYYPLRLTNAEVQAFSK